MQAVIVVALVSLTIQAGLTVAASRRTIRDYQTITVSREALASLPSSHWAIYDLSTRDAKYLSSASRYDDNPSFDPVDFCMPFYQLSQPGWYISSNGFLSPLPTAMSPYFSSGPDSDPTSGYYQLLPRLPSGGGSWPSIQLYTYDLDPRDVTASPGAAIYKRTYCNKSYGSDNVTAAIVEFRRVPQFNDNPARASLTFTAEVELWANGTIILRYDSTFDSTASLSIPPTTGITLTALQRKYRPSPVNASVVAAIRYEPILDACNAFTSCLQCASAANVTGASTNGTACRWCASEALCVDSSVANDYCPSQQQNLCLLPDVGTASVPQVFYTLGVHQPLSSTDPFFGGNVELPYVNVSFTRFVSAALYNVSLPFSFPIFYNPPVWNYSDVRIRKTVWLANGGFLAFMGSTSPCLFSDYCTSGQYPYTLVPLSTYNAIRLNASVTVTFLPNRTNGDPFCSSVLCREAAVVRSQALRRDWQTSVRDSNSQLWNFDILIDGDGNVAVHYTTATAPNNTVSNCSASVPIEAYPTPVIGLFKNGVSDLTGVSVPYSALGTGITVTFTPVPSCKDCGIGGFCNRTSLLCVCSKGFQGEVCDACQPGYFGAQCQQCPNCTNGVCMDGKAGSGGCKCTEPYSGQDCTVKCASAPFNCNDDPCNSKGGYCLCGKCVCDSSRGWSGKNCSTWSDPCYRYSLDGCQVCTTKPRNVTCLFCSSAVCFADPLQENIGKDNFSYSSCSSYSSNTTCTVIPQSPQNNNGVAVIIVIIIFGGLGFSSCFILVIICSFRKPRTNLLVGHAVTGTPNFQFPKREREVIQMVLLPPEGKKGRPVQGIPLRQIALKELYEYQQEKRRLSGTRNIRDWDLRREV